MYQNLGIVDPTQDVGYEPWIPQYPQASGWSWESTTSGLQKILPGIAQIVGAAKGKPIPSQLRYDAQGYPLPIGQPQTANWILPAIIGIGAAYFLLQPKKR